MPSETNYTPDPWGVPDSAAATCVFGNCSGNGPPSNSIGFDGATYVDELTGDFYLKINNTWVQFSGGGGGVSIVSSAPVADPGDGPQLAYNPTTGEVWMWSGTTWDLVLGGGA